MAEDAPAHRVPDQMVDLTVGVRIKLKDRDRFIGDLKNIGSEIRRSLRGINVGGNVRGLPRRGGRRLGGGFCDFSRASLIFPITEIPAIIRKIINPILSTTYTFQACNVIYLPLLGYR